MAFVLQKPQTTGTTVSNAILTNKSDATVNPLDSLSSADIALNVAKMSQLPETVSVSNLADTVNSQLSVTPADAIVVTQPQIIATGLKSRADIQFYTVKKGDSIESIAEKFGITSETIRWSNNIAGDSVSPGDRLVISPINGLVYTVQSSDTIDSLVAKYHFNKERFIAFNDLESGRLPVGHRVILPDARKVITASQQTLPSFGTSATLIVGGGGGYDPGWCTWYAAMRAGVPGGWGNAQTWNIYAPLYGWTVSTAPRVGAVAQTSSGWGGHVGIVEAVSPDGKMIKYSDMNGLAGFNRVGYSGWVPATGRFQRFIYH